MAEKVTITVSEQTRECLETIKQPGESIDGTISRLLNEGEET